MRRPRLSTRSRACQECSGRPRAGQSLVWYRKRWICGDCMNGNIIPLRIDDFMHSGITNLGDAQIDEMHAEHWKGGRNRSRTLGRPRKSAVA